MIWEYHFEVMDIDSTVGDDPVGESETRLNALGAEGWEVVVMLPKMGKKNSWTIVLLKRPVG